MPTITTWNIRHGGGSRLQQITAVLDGYSSSDVLVITEYRPNKNGKAIRAFFEEKGYDHQFATVTEEKKNGVLVASRLEFEAKTDTRLSGHSHRVAIAQFEGFTLYGCYFPQQKEKQKVFDYLIEECANSDRSIITGDINTGLHFIDEKGKSFYCAGALHELNQAMPDAYRHLHGEKKEYSWFSNAGNGFRIDHFIVSPALLGGVQSCEYDHEPRESKASDHSAMSLALSL